MCLPIHPEVVGRCQFPAGCWMDPSGPRPPLEPGVGVGGWGGGGRGAVSELPTAVPT